MPRRPTFSVVIAAYNSRSRLMCAVESALHQTKADDLEIVVVGDGVTDDSGEALAGLHDPRIVWENLEANWGEQSVPSNRGIELARGDTILFLNQDDLWLPNHVESCYALMSEHDLDVAFSRFLVVAPGSQPGGMDSRNTLMGVPRKPPDFDPMAFVSASATAWRAEALRSLGGWRRAGEVAVSPSQDLLYRASRAGVRMRMTATPTVLVLWSGQRKGSFAPGYQATDNVTWLAAVNHQPMVVAAEIAGAAAAAAAAKPSRGRRALRAFSAGVLQPLQEALGVHPASLQLLRRHWRSGGFVNAARQGADLDRRAFRPEPKGKGG